MGDFIKQGNSSPGEPYNADKMHDDIKYTEEDDKAIDDWVAGPSDGEKNEEIFYLIHLSPFRPCRDDLAQSW